mmetsp:Transcript_2007/g.4522  ORF Transcript_2007/g.4522 Transcript_2007/m.4522 type:complete len:268 (-) Transcript_2007:2563-3366(-)
MQSNASLTNYIKEIPFSTRLLFIVIVFAFALEAVLEYYEVINTFDVAICLQPIRDPPHQFYRIVSSAFTHGNVQHIAFNCFALLGLGRSLERKLGSMAFLALSGALVKLTGFFYLAICFGLTFVPESYGGGESWAYRCAVGYSGVLFSYLYIDCVFSESEYVCFNIRFSRKLIPWAFLVGTQLLMWDSASFLGHFCGILVGVGYSTRLLCCIMPRYSCFEKVEGMRCCSFLHNFECYAEIPEFKPVQRGMRRDPTFFPIREAELSSL